MSKTTRGLQEEGQEQAGLRPHREPPYSSVLRSTRRRASEGCGGCCGTSGGAADTELRQEWNQPGGGGVRREAREENKPELCGNQPDDQFRWLLRRGPRRSRMRTALQTSGAPGPRQLCGGSAAAQLGNRGCHTALSLMGPCGRGTEGHEGAPVSPLSLLLRCCL